MKISRFTVHTIYNVIRRSYMYVILLMCCRNLDKLTSLTTLNLSKTGVSYMYQYMHDYIVT